MIDRACTQAEEALNRQIYRMIRRALQIGRGMPLSEIDKSTAELQNYHSIITNQAINAVVAERVKCRENGL
jgi:hypothetical protein